MTADSTAKLAFPVSDLWPIGPETPSACDQKCLCTSVLRCIQWLVHLQHLCRVSSENGYFFVRIQFHTLHRTIYRIVPYWLYCRYLSVSCSFFIMLLLFDICFYIHIHLGLSENRVYSQWNSHLIGIMISKTIGFRGTLFSDTPTW